MKLHQNIKQKHAKGPQEFEQNHPQEPVSRSRKAQSVQEEGSGEIPTESTYAGEGKMQVDTFVKTEGFGEIPKESIYARAGSTQLCKKAG